MTNFAGGVMSMQIVFACYREMGLEVMALTDTFPKFPSLQVLDDVVAKRCGEDIAGGKKSRSRVLHVQNLDHPSCTLHTAMKRDTRRKKNQ